MTRRPDRRHPGGTIVSKPGILVLLLSSAAWLACSALPPPQPVASASSDPPAREVSGEALEPDSSLAAKGRAAEVPAIEDLISESEIIYNDAVVEYEQGNLAESDSLFREALNRLIEAKILSTKYPATYDVFKRVMDEMYAELNGSLQQLDVPGEDILTASEKELRETGLDTLSLAHRSGNTCVISTAPARPPTRPSPTSPSPRTRARSRPAPRAARTASPSTTACCASKRSSAPAAATTRKPWPSQEGPLASRPSAARPWCDGPPLVVPGRIGPEGLPDAPRGALPSSGVALEWRCPPMALPPMALPPMALHCVIPPARLGSGARQASNECSRCRGGSIRPPASLPDAG